MGKYDYKGENEVLKDMVKCKEKWTRCGGPIRQKEMDLYIQMGQKEYIKHL